MLDLEVRFAMNRAFGVVRRDLARIQKFAAKEWALELALLPEKRARFANALLDRVARAAEGIVQNYRLVVARQ